MQFQFPPFEGKVARFNKLNVKHVVRLPYKPDRSDVYILSCSESEFIKTDGWRWSSANKSNKLNFANIPGIQKAVKFRCAVTDCTAVKFVDIVYKYCLARVYYDGEHKHNKTKSNLSEVLRPNEAFDKKRGGKHKYINNNTESDDDFEKPVVKSKRFEKSNFVADQMSKPKVPGECIEIENQLQTSFNPAITSTPLPSEVRIRSPSTIGLGHEESKDDSDEFKALRINQKRSRKKLSVFSNNPKRIVTKKSKGSKPRTKCGEDVEPALSIEDAFNRTAFSQLPLDVQLFTPSKNLAEHEGTNEILQASKGQEVQLRVMKDAIATVVKENSNIQSEIKSYQQELNILNKENESLINKKVQITTDIDTIKKENFALENSLKLAHDEIKASKIRNARLKQSLLECQSDEELLGLDEQIIVLENLIVEKRKRQEQSGEIQVLEASLNACSEKKKEVLKNKFDKHVLMSISRNLMHDFESSKNNTEESNVSKITPVNVAPPTFSIAPQTFSIAPPTFSIAFPTTLTQCLSVGPGPRTQSVTVPQQGQFIAGALTRHLNAWRQVTDDYVSLQAIVGVKIPLVGKPPVRRASRAELDERRVDPIIDEAVKVVSIQAVLVSLINSPQELLNLKAVQEMQEDDEVFLSRVFTVPKTERGKEYGRWFILNLKVSLFHTC